MFIGMTTAIHPGEMTKTVYVSLAKVKHGPCLSFFVESSTSPEHVNATLKALRREAFIRLGELGLSAAEADRFLNPLAPYLKESNLAVADGQTLGIFLSASDCSSFSVPLAIRTRLVASQRFYLKPVLPCLLEPQQYHVLAISENSAHLFQCSGHECHKVQVAGLPKSLKDVFASRDFASSLQAHSSGVPGHQPLTYHGHSGPVEEVHKNRVAYCRHISAAIEKHLQDCEEALILACVSEYLPAFREVSRFKGLVHDAIAGNPDRLTIADIQHASRKMIDALTKERMLRDIKEYVDVRNTPRSSSSLAEILAAVFDGRVKSVFVRAGIDVWGVFDPGTNALSLNGDAASAGSEEMLNLAAIESVLHGGIACLVPAADMPENEPIVAVFRY